MGNDLDAASMRARASEWIGRFPLSLKIGVPLTVVSILTAATFAITQGLGASGAIDRSAANNAEGIANYVNSYIAVAGWPADLAPGDFNRNADQFVTSLRTTDPSVKGIRIFRAALGTEMVYASSVGAGDNAPSASELKSAIAGATEVSNSSVSGQATLKYVSPIRITGKPWGAVEIEYSLADRVAAVDRIWRDTALVTGAGLLIELLLFWLVFRSVVLRRLRGIAKVVQGLARHDLEQPCLEHGVAPGHDELAIVGNHIDEMVGSMRRRTLQDKVLFDLGLRAARATDLTNLLRETAQAVETLMPSAVLVAHEILGDEPDLYVRAIASSIPHLADEPPHKLGDSAVLSYIVSTGNDIFYEEGKVEDRYDISTIVARGVRSGIGVTIPGELRPFGVLAAYSHEATAFETSDLAFVRALAAVIGATAARMRAARDRDTSESRMHATFTSSPAGITFIDHRTGNILDANPAFCNALGYSAEELRERSVLDILHPDDLGWATAEIAGALDPTVPSAFEMDGMVPDSALLEQRFIARDGSVVWMQMSAGLVRDSAGEPAYFQSTCLDVTQRKAAEATLQSTLSLLRRTGEDRQRLMTSLVQAQQHQTKAAADLHHHVTQVLAGSALELERLAAANLDGDISQKLDITRAAVSKALDELLAVTERRGGHPSVVGGKG